MTIFIDAHSVPSLAGSPVEGGIRSGITGFDMKGMARSRHRPSERRVSETNDLGNRSHGEGRNQEWA